MLHGYRLTQDFVEVAKSISPSLSSSLFAYMGSRQSTQLIMLMGFWILPPKFLKSNMRFGALCMCILATKFFVSAEGATAIYPLICPLPKYASDAITLSL